MYLQRCLIVIWLVPRETAAISARSVYVVQPCTMSRHFMQIHIRMVHACLVVTCHLHFWQNDRDLLRATAVTQGWNGYRNGSQHRKSTLEKKILPPLLPGLEPDTFRSRVRHSNHWAIPAPQLYCCVKRNAINSHSYPSHMSLVSWRSLPNTSQTLAAPMYCFTSDNERVHSLSYSVHAESRHQFGGSS